MVRETILDMPSATLWYYPEQKIIHHELKKFAKLDDLIQLLTTGTETLKANRARKWLSDDRKNTVLPAGLMEWSEKSWMQPTIQAGFRYWALVKPEAAIAQIGMKQVIEQFARVGIVAEFFTDPDKAMEWLARQ